MEQLTFTLKRKIRELEYISTEFSENLLYFEEKYDKLRYNVFTVILPLTQMNTYEQNRDYLIIVDNKSKLTNFFENLGYCKAIKREIKRFNEIPLLKLKFDIDNHEFAINTRKDYQQLKNLKGNPKLVIFEFRKHQIVSFPHQKSFRELIG
ncbi:hypothetical protein DSAG12_02269 [Promethearchaeum syntrophicum]|uniref:Uncharacterized protein n=1 Tax=Promethearchaeum syntrophicum TaxID=2594042 RepID=A0A5B9DB15_9ARCH|nr:hypothetical protein [Candidatus Prometheoarchaeum syntrophicum]QEE16439.1 hypothetical protein DSAG12_02269 [Candidatus Prometheoarchaeum syntrophicum]